MELIKKDVDVEFLYVDQNLFNLVKDIESKAMAVVPDMTTKTGRDEIRSLARQVASSKVFLDNTGIAIVADWKEKSKVIDERRKKMRDYLDNVRDKVRQPLTDYEAEEERKKLEHENSVREEFHRLVLLAYKLGDSSEVIKIKQANTEKFLIKYDENTCWADEQCELLKSKFIDIKAYEDEQVELETLRKEKAEREAKEARKKVGGAITGQYGKNPHEKPSQEKYSGTSDENLPKKPIDDAFSSSASAPVSVNIEKNQRRRAIACLSLVANIDPQDSARIIDLIIAGKVSKVTWNPEG